MLQIASARLRTGPSAYNVLISASVAGNSNAAPMPCAARAMINRVAFGASAPNSDASANSSMQSKTKTSAVGAAAAGPSVASVRPGPMYPTLE